MTTNRAHYDPELLSRFLADRQSRIHETTPPAAKRWHWSDAALALGFALALLLVITSTAAQRSRTAEPAPIVFNWNSHN